VIFRLCRQPDRLMESMETKMAQSHESRREKLGAVRRIVVKVGTRVLTHEDGRIALSRMFDVVEALAESRRQGREMLLVTSGAVGMGREALGLEQPVTDLADRQACAAVGQSRLMELYHGGFSRLGIHCAQVLLTQDDFGHRVRYLNLRAALLALVRRGVVPIINENDVVSTVELAWYEGAKRPIFGDNDCLSALVAAKLGSDLLVLLTDVDGLYDRDPHDHADATLLDRVDDIAHLEAEVSGSTSGVGRGGMQSKIEAAAIAARSGCDVIIASGLVPGNLSRILQGQPIGTWVPARGPLSARQRWIAFASKPRGVATLDAGAVCALIERGASLLPPGVTALEGEFDRGDVLELRDVDGRLIGRGMAEVNSSTARRWLIGEIPVGARNHHALVHRDHMVLEEK